MKNPHMGLAAVLGLVAALVSTGCEGDEDGPAEETVVEESRQEPEPRTDPRLEPREDYSVKSGRSRSNYQRLDASKPWADFTISGPTRGEHVFTVGPQLEGPVRIEVIDDANGDSKRQDGEVVHSYVASPPDGGKSSLELPSGEYILRLLSEPGSGQDTTTAFNFSYSYAWTTAGPDGVQTVSSAEPIVGRSVEMNESEPEQSYLLHLPGIEIVSIQAGGLEEGQEILVGIDVDGDGRFESAGESWTLHFEQQSFSLALPPGDYPVGLYRQGADVRFVLDIGTETTPEGLSEDPGRRPSEAYSIGEDLRGTLSFSDYVGSRDSTDYYRLDLPVAGDVTIRFPDESGPIRSGFVLTPLLQDSDGDGRFSSEEELGRIPNYPEPGQPSVVLRRSLESGEYFIRIRAQSLGGVRPSVAYTMEIEVSSGE
jgi:hypothetical protein